MRVALPPLIADFRRSIKSYSGSHWRRAFTSAMSRPLPVWGAVRMRGSRRKWGMWGVSPGRGSGAASAALRRLCRTGSCGVLRPKPPQGLYGAAMAMARRRSRVNRPVGAHAHPASRPSLSQLVRKALARSAAGGGRRLDGEWHGTAGRGRCEKPARTRGPDGLSALVYRLLELRATPRY
jgi:hypothetical protein